MDFERGYIYELDDGWGYIRLLDMMQRYESFDPDEPGEKLVRVISIDENGDVDGTPFQFKFDMFKNLIVENHGYAIDADLY